MKYLILFITTFFLSNLSAQNLTPEQQRQSALQLAIKTYQNFSSTPQLLEATNFGVLPTSAGQALIALKAAINDPKTTINDLNSITQEINSVNVEITKNIPKQNPSQPYRSQGTTLTPDQIQAIRAQYAQLSDFTTAAQTNTSKGLTDPWTVAYNSQPATSSLSDFGKQNSDTSTLNFQNQ